MPHTFEPDDSGLSCTRCPMGPNHRAHAVLDAVQPVIPLDTAPVTALHGRDTSHQAAAKAAPRYGTVRAQVLAAIEGRPSGYGATDDELEALTGRSHQSLSACRNSLMRDGLIEPQPGPDGATVKRPTRHGNDATAWRATDAGRLALAAQGGPG